MGATPSHAFAAGSALASTSLGTTLAVLQPQPQVLSRSPPESYDSSAVSAVSAVRQGHDDVKEARAEEKGEVFDLRRTKLGTALLGAAVMDDVVAFIFAKVLSVLGSSSSSSATSTSSSALGPALGRALGTTLALALLLPLVSYYLLRPLYLLVASSIQSPGHRDGNGDWVKKVFAAVVGSGTSGTAGVTVGMLLLWMACVAAAVWGGTSALVGSYLAGLVLSYLGNLKVTQGDMDGIALQRQRTGHRRAIDGPGQEDGIVDVDVDVERGCSRLDLEHVGEHVGGGGGPEYLRNEGSTGLESSSIDKTASLSPLSIDARPTRPGHPAARTPVPSSNIRAATSSPPFPKPEPTPPPTPASSHPASIPNTPNTPSHNPFETAFQTHLSPLLVTLLAPLFFASIGYSIPFLSLWRGEIVWKGMVYAGLMGMAKAACGGWVVLATWLKDSKDGSRALGNQRMDDFGKGNGLEGGGELGLGVGAGRVRDRPEDNGTGRGQRGGDDAVRDVERGETVVGPALGEPNGNVKGNGNVNDTAKARARVKVEPKVTAAPGRKKSAAWRGGVLLGLGMVARGEIGLLYVRPSLF